MKRASLIFAPLLFAGAVHAVVVAGGSEKAHRSAPPDGAPWRAVAMLEKNYGGFQPRGSGVHIGGGFILTAAHCEVPDRVRLDGKIYQLDASFPRVQAGRGDLALVRLAGRVTAPTAVLIGADESDLDQTGVLIGCGVGGSGRGPVWSWAGDTSMAQRWGAVRSEKSAAKNQNGVDILTTKFSSTHGTAAGQAAMHDSGGGLFLKTSGGWRLAGIVSSVSTMGRARLDADTTSYTRLRTERAAIEEARGKK